LRSTDWWNRRDRLRAAMVVTPLVFVPDASRGAQGRTMTPLRAPDQAPCSTRIVNMIRDCAGRPDCNPPSAAVAHLDRPRTTAMRPHSTHRSFSTPAPRRSTHDAPSATWEPLPPHRLKGSLSLLLVPIFLGEDKQNGAMLTT
jgi:hypothetical protein